MSYLESRVLLNLSQILSLKLSKSSISNETNVNRCNYDDGSKSLGSPDPALLDEMIATLILDSGNKIDLFVSLHLAIAAK